MNICPCYCLTVQCNSLNHLIDIEKIFLKVLFLKVTGYRLQVGFGVSPTVKPFFIFLFFYFFWYMEPYINL